MTMQTFFAHDPAVPHRDRLLDVDEMRGHLHGRFGTRDDAPVHAVRIKYRPLESLRVVYRVDGEQRRIATARTFPPARAQTTLAGEGADFTVPELGAAFWAFPHDRRLRDVERVLNPDQDLRSCVPGWVRSELVGYAPEKCAVLACLDIAHRPVAFAKVFCDEKSVARVCDLHLEIASSVKGSEDVTIARILAAVSAYRTVFVAPAHGDRIADLPPDRLPAALHRMGRAVARIHQAPIPGGVRASDRAEPAALRDAALLVGRVRPNLKHRALLVAAELATARQDDDEVVLLHGDLHLKNAFLDGRRVSVIDFDQAAYGPAAADIGSLLAALQTRGVTPARDFLDGYAAVRPLPSATSLAWHTAAALLRERAVRAITRVRVQTLNDLDRVIDDARTLTLTAGGRL